MTKDTTIKKMSEVAPIEFLAFGVAELDKVCAVPRAHISVVWGDTSVGKTDLMLRCAVHNVEAGKKVLFIDTEFRLNPDRFTKLGGKNMDIAQLNIQEEVANLLIDNVSKYDLIIVDSLAGLSPRAEQEGEVGNANIGVNAKLNWQWVRMIRSTLHRANCALVLVTQQRQSPSIYQPIYMAGGDTVKFNSSLTLQLSSNNSSDKIVKEKELVGRKVTVKITKSNLGTEKNGKKRLFLGQEATFRLLF